MSVSEMFEQWMPRMERVVAAVLEEAMPEAGRSSFRLGRAQKSLEGLSKGGTADYDWPEVGWLYSSYYHLRRVTTSLPALANAWSSAEGARKLHLVDIGCGTAPVLWGLWILRQRQHNARIAGPEEIVYSGMDGSPVMLNWARRLWTALIEEGGSNAVIDVHFDLNSWHHAMPADAENTWLFATYLFDAANSDRELALRKSFGTVVERCRADGVSLQSSFKKKQLVDAAVSSLPGPKWAADTSDLLPLQRYRCVTLERVRQALAARAGVALPGEVNAWDESTVTATLRRSHRSKSPQEWLPPYGCPLSEIRRIPWDEGQRAAFIAPLPAIVTGPPGSGKSVVLVRRVREALREIEERLDRRTLLADPVRILVVTFNKGVVSQLCGWLDDIRPPSFDRSYRAGEFNYTVDPDDQLEGLMPAVEIVNIDQLVPRLLRELGVEHCSAVNGKTCDELARIANRVKTERRAGRSYSDIADPEFLQEEFVRVYYGLGLRTKQAYMEGVREGRGNSPSVREARRDFVFECLSRFRAHARNDEMSYWELRRLLLHERLIEVAPRYSHVFVEESQDFLRADFEILYRLLTHPNNVFVTGDLSQAIRTGASAHVPRADEMSRNFSRKALTASYRVPYQIAQCLRPLAVHIHEQQDARRSRIDEDMARDMNPRPDAAPGIRPVIIWRDAVEEQVAACSDVIRTFADASDLESRGGRVTVMERHGGIASGLQESLKGSVQCKVDADSIDAIKGQERWGVVWATETKFRIQDTALEAAFTVMSRASFLLIILIGSATNPSAWEALRLLHRDHMLFWDEGTEARFLSEIGQGAGGAGREIGGKGTTSRAREG